MNLKLQTVQPEFLAKLLSDVESFKSNVDDFVNDYTDTSVSAAGFISLLISQRLVTCRLSHVYITATRVSVTRP